MFARVYSFTASGSVTHGGKGAAFCGVNILGGVDAATVRVVGATSGKVYGAVGVSAGQSNGCTPAAPVALDGDEVLTVTITGTTPAVSIYVS